MPRRIYTYQSGLGWDLPNLISSIGSFIMAIGIATVLLDIVLHFRFGQKATKNPWNADTLEWSTHLPPSPYNFVSLPPVRTRHPLWELPDLEERIDRGEFALTVIDHGRRETWGIEPLTGKVREIIHLPGNSWWPFIASLFIAFTCLGLLSKFYWVALVASIVAVLVLLRWSWENGAHPLAAPDARVQPGEPPLHSRTCDGPGLWGMGVTLLANGALYLSLLFGWFYLWTVSPNWLVPDDPVIDQRLLLVSAVLLSIAVLWQRPVLRRLRQGQGEPAALITCFVGTALLGALHAGLLLWAILAGDLAPRATAHDAVIVVMLVYSLAHGALATILSALQALRVHYGYVCKRTPYEPLVVEQFWQYSLAVMWISYCSVVLFPPTFGGV